MGVKFTTFLAQKKMARCYCDLPQQKDEKEKENGVVVDDNFNFMFAKRIYLTYVSGAQEGPGDINFGFVRKWDRPSRVHGLRSEDILELSPEEHKILGQSKNSLQEAEMECSRK